jgi:hypothetical protein
MGLLDITDTQRTLIILASVPVIVKSFFIYFYPGTNPLQTNIPYILLLTVLTIAAIFIYYRITA